MKKNLKGMVPSYDVVTSQFSHGKVSYKDDLFNRIWYSMYDGKAVQVKVNKISWGTFEEDNKTSYTWMVHFVRATDPKTRLITNQWGIQLYRTPEDAYANEQRVDIGITKDDTPCGYNSVSLVQELKAMGFQEADTKGCWNSSLYARLFYPLHNGGVGSCYCNLVVYADKNGWHIEPKIPEGKFRSQQEALASVKMEVVEFPSDDELDEEDFAEQKRDEFYKYVAHHCPGCEDNIEWEYFQNLQSMPWNLAEQVRVWKS